MKNRPCVYCGAAWWGERFPDPDHTIDCPMVTGLFPVTDAEVADQMVCPICHDEFARGDSYARVPITDDTVVIVCIICAVLRGSVSFP